MEAEIAKALEKLEQEDASADELKKAQLGVKRAMYVPPRSFVVSADKSIGKRRWLPLDNHDIAFISFIVQAASDMIQGAAMAFEPESIHVAQDTWLYYGAVHDSRKPSRPSKFHPSAIPTTVSSSRHVHAPICH